MTWLFRNLLLLTKSSFLLILTTTSLFLFSTAITTTNAGTCSLENIPPDSSPAANPYKLPMISDSVGAGIIVWEHQLLGTVEKTGYHETGDYKYLTGALLRLSGGRARYRVRTNEFTRNFTRERTSRGIERHIIFYCTDPDGGSSSSSYYFRTPIQDMAPPKFEQETYTFKITPNWPSTRPISEGHFVIASDEAYEIGNHNKPLQFSTSPENILKIVAVPLWVEPNQERYYHRVDIYLDGGKVLTPGEHFQVVVSAKDQFNAGRAVVDVIVLDGGNGEGGLIELN